VATSFPLTRKSDPSLLLGARPRKTAAAGYVPVMVEVREIGAAELPHWVELRARDDPRPATLDAYLDWARQAEETAWFTGSLDGEDAATGIAVLGWHAPPGVARAGISVIPGYRSRGLGAALLAALGSWARERGYEELMAAVSEDDADSFGWAERRGFREVGRNSLLVLDLEGVEAPEVDPPEGIEIVSWADRPDVARGMYDVAREAYPDVPGEDNDEMAVFEDWLSVDMQGSGDRPEATFVALAGREVVGYAKFSLGDARPNVAFHDMTGVKRAWRGRGIAAALKRAEIAWAKENGFTRLETFNEERNEPIRRLNERYGYRLEPGEITVRGPISTA
jgi:mycothiol synthase